MFSTEKIGAIAIQTDIEELTKIYTHDKRTHTDSRPWVMLNMIASSNGLATLDGLSGKLGGEEDRALFKTLRGIADFILVGLKTVHEEKYNPPELSEAAKSLREATGRDRTPRVAVVSNSLEIDPKIPLFASDQYSPVLITSESSPAAKRKLLSEKYEIILAGEERVDFKRAINQLSMEPKQTVLVEGGPSINKQLVSDDLFDELCITISPFHSDDESVEKVTTDINYPNGHMKEVRRISVNDFIFCRYLRIR